MLSPRVQSSVVSFTIDGETETLEVWSDESALRALQGRHSRTRFPSSCEQGLCGTCEVLVDGQPTRICLLAAVRLDGTVIELPPRWTATAQLPGAAVAGRYQLAPSSASQQRRVSSAPVR